MTCGACYRRVDPTRSFCQTCGSAVFIDEDDRPWRVIREQRQQAMLAVPQATGTRSARPARTGRQSQQISRASDASLQQSIGCLRSLIRSAIFAAILWFAITWLFSIPEVQALFDAALRGSFSDEQLRSAGDAILRSISEALGTSPGR